MKRAYVAAASTAACGLAFADSRRALCNNKINIKDNSHNQIEAREQ